MVREFRFQALPGLDDARDDAELRIEALLQVRLEERIGHEIGGHQADHHHADEREKESRTQRHG